jgi:hypothetical protein
VNPLGLEYVVIANDRLLREAQLRRAPLRGTSKAVAGPTPLRFHMPIRSLTWSARHTLAVYLALIFAATLASGELAPHWL